MTFHIMRYNNTLYHNNNILYDDDSSDNYNMYHLFSIYSYLISFLYFIYHVFFSDFNKPFSFYIQHILNYDYEHVSENENENENENEKYTNLYYKELEKLENRNLEKEDLEKLNNVFINETTPNGNVIMKFNHNTESFEYYCDDKNIKYIVLDTVARKLAIDNNCKLIYVNYIEEFEKAKLNILNSNHNSTNTTTTTTTTTKNSPTNTKRSIYAKFKNYNKKYNDSSSNNNTEQKFVLLEKSNRFTYKGKLSNFKHNTNLIDNSNNIFKKNIDFNTFKNMNYHKNQ